MGKGQSRAKVIAQNGNDGLHYENENMRSGIVQVDCMDTQPHYDNTHGSLYKIAQERGWNAYQFDAIKRIDRALKKGNFDEDILKTKVVLDIWRKEQS